MKRFAKILALLLTLALLLSGCKVADFIRYLDDLKNSTEETRPRKTKAAPTEESPSSEEPSSAEPADPHLIPDGYYAVYEIGTDLSNPPDPSKSLRWRLEGTTLTSFYASGGSQKFVLSYDPETGIYSSTETDREAERFFAEPSVNDRTAYWILSYGKGSSSLEPAFLLVPAEDPAREGEAQILFDTVDMNGIRFTSDDFFGSSLTMINYWAYWCGPCTGEMPDLQKLWKTYRDAGLQIWGISDEADESGNLETISSLGITYPCLRYTSAFDPYLNTGYIPTTIFVDSSGHVVGETIIGSRSYEEWAAIIESLLK